MQGVYNNIKIAGMAAAVPETVSNSEIFEKVIGERKVRKQRKLTGIYKSHVSPVQQRTSDLCYEAARKLLDHLNWKPEEIDVLIFASQTTNYILPSTAFMLQKRLNISNECIAYDMNLGCSSFNVGTQAVAAHLTAMPEKSKGLLLTGDICTQIHSERKLEPEGLKNLMLFGSAGAAVAIENCKNSDFRFLAKSNGNNYEAIIRFSGRPTEMIGNAVFDFAINEVSDDIIKFRNDYKISEDKVNFYIFHQAQKLIVDSIVDTCGIEEDKVLNSYEEYGNTSGASIPLTICANRDLLKDSGNLFMSGFGVGLSWTCLFTAIKKENVLPVIYTDEHYDDDKRARGELWNKTILSLGLDDVVCNGTVEVFNTKSLKQAINVAEDEEILSWYEENVIWNNQSIKTDNITDVKNYLLDNKIKINGILVSCAKYSSDDLIELINWVEQNNLLDGKHPSVVLLDGSDRDIDVKRADLCEMLERIKPKYIRVNMIHYKEEQLIYKRKLNRELEWIEEYFEAKFDMGLTRMLDIGNMSYYLLSDDVYSLNKSVLVVDGSIEVR